MNVSIGKARRLHKILPPKDRAAIFSPLDDSLLAGPTNGLQELENIIAEIAAARPDAIIAFKGLIQNFHQYLQNIPLILNVTASTTLGAHTRKQMVSSVEEALAIGCDAVAVHVNISSQYEPEMLHILGMVSKDCNYFGMPLLAHMYFRSEYKDGADNNYIGMKTKRRALYAHRIAHAARVGMELGADIIKVQYPGDPESLKTIVAATKPIPLVIAGGSIVSEAKALKISQDALAAGVRGISFGRNIFGREHPRKFIQKLRKLT